MKDVDIRIESVGDMEAKIDLDTQDLLQLSFYPEIVIEAKAFDWPVEAQLLDAKVSALGQLAQDAIQTAGASGALASEAIQEAQSAVQEASGALIQSKEYTDQELAKITPKSIEVVLTENVPKIDIDLSVLELKAGDVFTVSASLNILDLSLNPSDSRILYRFNDNENYIYTWASGVYNSIQITALNATYKNELMTVKINNQNIISYQLAGCCIVTDNTRRNFNYYGYVIEPIIPKFLNIIAAGRLFKIGDSIYLDKLT